MALTQRLLKDTVNTGFVLGTTDSVMTTDATVGNIVSETGAQSYYDWAVSMGMAASDIGQNQQSSTTMCAFVAPDSAVNAGRPFNYYANGVLQGDTAKLQQPISWNSSLTPDDVVWGVYFPQIDSLPSAGVGMIKAYSTTVNSAPSVATNDPDESGARSALETLLGEIGNKFAGVTVKGPTLAGGGVNALFGELGAIAFGAFISYSNQNGTWLVYAG